MRAKPFFKASIGGLVLYLVIAIYFLFSKDRVHSLMFLSGAILWVVSIFIWNRNVEHEE